MLSENEFWCRVWVALFATSHGKSACDGIAGVVKKITAKARPQRSLENQILTPQDMYTFCKENFGEKISFSYFQWRNREEKILATRFQNARLIPGTQKLYQIIPTSNGRVKIYETPNPNEGEEKIQKKMWFKIWFTQNVETMSFVNMMTKFGWHSSALTVKSLMILKLNCCIRVDIINIIAILK